MRYGPARGIGYEGFSLDTFLQRLAAEGITVVADVRLTPISRKRGFSKRALAACLSDVGIGYLHMPSLGNPKWNRAGFAGPLSERDRAKNRYRECLGSAEAQDALAQLRLLTDRATVGVLCFEADEQGCHRSVVLEAIALAALAYSRGGQ
jgi:uncharacterized protein (DUF488 family)